MNTLYEKSSREMLHSRRVSEICKSIAGEMNLNKDAINQIGAAGLMHDIGKMGIDEKILNKQGQLNFEEWQEIQRHPEIGYRILSSSNEFSELAKYVFEHHERWDGKGYPNKLAGDKISIQARIIGVADAYDAMTCDRTYRKGLSDQEAITELKRYSGIQFDPEVTQVFIEKVLKKDIN
jgi:putative nucleotidyltransferase with HDIG domain